MSEPDDLYSVRNHVWTGNYQAAAKECEVLTHLSAELRREKEFFHFRALLGLGQYGRILQGVGPQSTPGLQGVKLLASFLSQPDNREVIVLQMQEFLGSSKDSELRLMGGMLFLHAERIEDALVTLQNEMSLECLALMIQIYLSINRLDSARAVLQTMQTLDSEESTLTALAAAWIGVSEGGRGYQDACNAFRDLCDKFSPSPMLLISIAAALQGQNKHEEAEENLVEALGLDPRNADALVNIVCCSLHLGKFAEANTYKTQLLQFHPNHPFVQQLQLMSSTFDRVSGRFMAGR